MKGLFCICMRTFRKEGRAMRIEYRLFTERLENEERGSYIAYGLEAVAEGHVCRHISDISVDAAAVSSLVAQCNQKELDICHLDDVIEDWLA